MFWLRAPCCVARCVEVCGAHGRHCLCASSNNLSFLQHLADTAGGSAWSEVCYVNHCTLGITWLVPMLGQPGCLPAVSSSGLPSQWL